MSASRIIFLNTASGLALLGALALTSGCASLSEKRTVMLVDKPVPTTLTPARARLTDAALHADLALFERLHKSIEEFPVTSTARAEAEAWLEGAHAEYLEGSWQPWVDEATARATALVSISTPVATASDRELAAANLRGLDAWISHVRATRGFRAALPLLRRAEPLRAATELKPIAPGVADFHPHDWPETLFDLERRLAVLSDQGKMPLDCYAWAKAQAWIDFALDEHFARDRSGIVSEAAREATQLVRALEATSTPNDEALRRACETPPTLGRGHPENFYPELWAVAASAHAENIPHQLTEYAPRFAALAELDVALLQAAYERAERGLRTSHPYEQAARRIAAKVSSATP